MKSQAGRAEFRLCFFFVFFEFTEEGSVDSLPVP